MSFFVYLTYSDINLCLLGKPEIVSHEGPVDGQVRCVAEGFPAPRITWYYCEQPYARWDFFKGPEKLFSKSPCYYKLQLYLVVFLCVCVVCFCFLTGLYWLWLSWKKWCHTSLHHSEFNNDSCGFTCLCCQAIGDEIWPKNHALTVTIDFLSVKILMKK